MIVGVLKEVKLDESRVCMVPSGVSAMTAHGHKVVVEKDAGAAAGFPDTDYIACGALIAHSPAEVYRACDMVMHVGAPQPSEYTMLAEGQILFSHLYLAADLKLTRALIRAKSINIALESIKDEDGVQPLLVPMDEVTGCLAVQTGTEYLQTAQGGRGVLLGGVAGGAAATVVVFGGGVVGASAAKTAAGLGAQVYLLDTDPMRLRALGDVMPANVFPLLSQQVDIKEYLARADLVIGAELSPEGKTPKRLTREMLQGMKQGAVIIDAVIDRGGCFETSRPGSHTEPAYIIDGVVHCSIADITGAAAKTASLALAGAALPFALEIANKGWKRATVENRAIACGLSVACGKVTCGAVAEALDLKYTPATAVLDYDIQGPPLK